MAGDMREPARGERRDLGGGLVVIRADNPSPMTLDGTNSYILASADGTGCLLVDPGPEDADHKAALLAEVGDRELRAIVLTHRHADHSEMLGTVADWAPGVPVFAGLEEFCVDTVPLTGGEEIRFGEADADVLTVIATPGHTSDSVSLVFGETLLSGDTVLGRGTTVITHPEGSVADYLRSIETLLELTGAGRFTAIAPAHGEQIADPTAVLTHYLEHRCERLDQVRRAQADGAETLSEVCDVVYSDVPANVRPAVEQIVAAQLAYLSGEDR